MVSGMEVGSADGHKDDVRIEEARYMCRHVLAACLSAAASALHTGTPRKHMFTELCSTIVIHHFQPHELSLSSQRFLQTFDYNDAFDEPYRDKKKK